MQSYLNILVLVEFLFGNSGINKKVGDTEMILCNFYSSFNETSNQ